MSQSFHDDATGREIRPFHRTQKYVWAFTHKVKDGAPVLHSLRIKRIRIKRIIVVRKGDH